jgi:hypothetical protein
MPRDMTLLFASAFSRGVLRGAFECIRWDHTTSRLAEAGMVTSQAPLENLTDIDRH